MSKRILTAGRQSSNSKEREAIATFASSIGHELNNYLASISICAELSERKLKDIRTAVSNTSYFINNLQLQIKGVIAGKIDKSNFKRLSITDNINDVLAQYPFKTGERELITVIEGKDFIYHGDHILTNHILHNLIKNSLAAINRAGKGEITIKLEPGAKYNKLIFKDTATGIPKEFLPKIFQLFATQNAEGGNGIGLDYCKEIMRYYGGGIVCNSIEKKLTTLTLKFPYVLLQ